MTNSCGFRVACRFPARWPIESLASSLSGRDLTPSPRITPPPIMQVCHSEASGLKAYLLPFPADAAALAEGGLGVYPLVPTAAFFASPRPPPSAAAAAAAAAAARQRNMLCPSLASARGRCQAACAFVLMCLLFIVPTLCLMLFLTGG